MRSSRAKALEDNIWKLKAIYFLSNLLFPIPVVVLFWMANGLNLTEVMILQSIFSIIVVVLELPTGYFADLYGRKTSLVIGSLTLFFGIIIYSLGHNFFQFLIAEILWGISASFLSGANLALLYDTLKNLGKERVYKKISGSVISYSFIAAIISSVAGGFIGKINLRLTFYACIPFFFILLLISLSLKEPRIYRRIAKKDYIKKFFFTIKKYIIKHSQIRALILYSAVLIAFTNAVLWLYQPYFKLSNIDIAYFGFIFALFNIIATLSSKYAYVIEEKVGKVRSLVMLPIILSISYFLMGKFVFYFAFGFAFIQQFVRGFSEPIITEYINSLTPSRIRATLLSAKSLLTKLFYASIIPVIGYIADIYTLTQALLVLGVTTLISGVLVVLILYKTKVI